MKQRRICTRALSILLAGALLLPAAAHAEKKGAIKSGATKNQKSKKTESSPLPRGLINKKDYGKEPTFVKSDKLTLNSQTRHFIYLGNVEVKQADLTMTCDSLEGFYDEQNQIQQMIAHKRVLVVKGPAIRAQGEQAIYERKSDTLTLTENPELQQNDSVLTADAIRIFLQEDRSEAQGAVRVKLVNKDQKAPKPS